MIYYVIDKENKVFYQGEDKQLAIEAKADNPTAIYILYQHTPEGDKFILREDH
jgi:hypothetical protein